MLLLLGRTLRSMCGLATDLTDEGARSREGSYVQKSLLQYKVILSKSGCKTLAMVNFSEAFGQKHHPCYVSSKAAKTCGPQVLNNLSSSCVLA